LNRGQSKINLPKDHKVNPRMSLFKFFYNFLRLDRVFKPWARGREQKNMLYGSQKNLSGSDEHVSRGIGTQQTSAKTIAGLNVDEGIERFGNKEIYAEVLRSYVDNTPPLLDLLRNPTRDNLDKYAIHVHGVKGSSYGISAFTVGHKAETLENAAKAGDFDFVCNNNNDFINSVETLMSNIVDILDEMKPRLDKPKKDKPDRELLAKLMAACTKYDMDEVNSLMAEIYAYEYESDDGLVPWLRENVSLTNFAEIREKLSILIDTLV